MIRRLWPRDGTGFDPATAEGSALLRELYRPPSGRWLRINLVSSLDGSATGPDGTSGTLTLGADRRVLGAIRRGADAVLVGAGSVRAEGYLLPRTARLVVLTASGDLRGHRIPADTPAGRVAVLCPPDAAGRAADTLGVPTADILPLPGPRIAPPAAVEALRGLGCESIVCEGGPDLAAQFLDADAVDELCLSLSPRLVGSGPRILTGLKRSRALRLHRLLADDEGVLYARWGLD